MLRAMLLIGFSLWVQATLTTSLLAGYSFQSIVDDSGEFSAFPQGTSINNNRELLFVAELDAGGLGLYRGAGPTFDLIAFSNGFSPYRSALFASTPDFNDHGDVIFYAVSFTQGSGIFTGPDPQSDVVATAQGPYSFVGQFPVINNAGSILFSATLPGDVSGLYRGPDPVNDLYVDNSGPFDGLSSDIALNDQGDIAFVATLDNGDVGVFTGTDPIADKVMDSSGPFSTFIALPRLSPTGDLIFFAQLDSGVRGIFSGPDPETDTIVDNSGDFEEVGGAFHLAGGGIAFGALYDDGKIGLFTGSDIENDRIIGTGDPLFGSTVVSIDARGFLNDQDDIAFSYELTDGTKGIAIGTLTQDGDFDGDGDVDGQDFLAWQRGETDDPFSQPDLDKWTQNYVQNSPLAAAHYVPEPATCQLGLLILLAATCCRASLVPEFRW